MREEQIKVPPDVLAGLEHLRDEGSHNMFEFNNVQYRADELGYYETVLWMAENKQAYIKGIFRGFKSEDDS